MRLLKFNLRAYFNRASFEPIKKPLEYAVISTPSQSLPLTYTVPHTTFIEVDLSYEVVRLLQESLEYKVVYTQTPILIDLDYQVQYTPVPISLPTTYCAKSASSTITDLIYKVQYTAPAITKNLRYLLEGEVPPIEIALTYKVVSSSSISKSLQYKVSPVITKSMTYHVHMNVLNLIQPKFRLRDMRVLAAGGHKIQSFRNIYKR